METTAALLLDAPEQDTSLGESGDIDLEFECDAPKYVDLDLELGQGQQHKDSDGWFEATPDTPFCERATFGEPLYQKTPTNVKVASLSSSVSNTPTPRPLRRPEIGFTSNSQVCEQENEENLVVKSLEDMRINPELAKKTSAPSRSGASFDKPSSRNGRTALTLHEKRPGPFIPIKSMKPLTIPCEFNFTSRNRAAVLPKVTSNTKQKARSAKPLSITKPCPFRFRTMELQRSINVPSRSPYVSTSERVREYNRTPGRFKQRVDSACEMVRNHALHLTKPVSPVLATASRVNRNKVQSSDDKVLEQASIKEFKATPLDLRVFQSVGDFGVPRIKKLPITIAKSPAFCKGRSKMAQK